jgi:hypothetical protein
MQFRAARALHAVIRPQRLRLAMQIDQLERRAARVRAGKRGMCARMPVLRHHHMAEHARAQQRVDARNDCVALVAGQRAAGHEIRLHVDDDEGKVLVGYVVHG